MNYVSSVAERAILSVDRAILSVDRFINQAMTYVWTSTLEHRCPGREFAPRLCRDPLEGEENYGGGDFCSPETEASSEDDQPLE
jgi:hypothetical protein